MISSIGRKIPKDSIPQDRSKVSKFELLALREWQLKVFNDKELIYEIFNGLSPYDIHDPKWWSLKQHYDDDPKSGGSRLIDWTTSPLCGLYFACIDWDGFIDDGVDGGLYVMMSPFGRNFASKEYVSKLSDFDREIYDTSGDNVDNYFSVVKHLEYPRNVIKEEENIRQISQDGYFIFSPYFDQPITKDGFPNPFFFIIPKECKKDISKELYSLGYSPVKIVRGKKGIEAHENLKNILDIKTV